MATQKVLVVGGGFGGVKAALELAEDTHYDVTLLSDQAELRYYPTLYHTATGGKRANSSIPLKEIFIDRPVTIAHGSAAQLDRKAHTITTTEGQSYNYDVLILALGVVTNYFGIPGMQENAFSIKTQTEAARLKAHLQQQIIEDKHPDSHYVIVGAGPTGIELAGALPTYIDYLMKKNGIKHRTIRVDLVEASPRLLPRMSKETSRIVKRRLKRLGIRLYVNSVVQAASPEQITINGKLMPTHTVIWTAGVTNHPFFKDNGFAIMGRGKVAVDTYLQAEDNIFVLGDNANTPYSGLAQTALHDGVFVAQNLRRRAHGKNFKSYTAKAPITVIPAGYHWAAVVWGKVSIHGWAGWLLREAADILGFHDLEPWPKAAKQFMTEFSREDS